MKGFYFVHIPKTGGTTLVKMLKDRFNILHIDEECKVDGYESYDIIFGHSSYRVYDHLPRVTFVRHPVNRLISQYSRYRNKMSEIITYPGTRKLYEEMDIVEFAESIPNMLLAYMGRDLSVFDYIGVQEYYSKSIEILSDMFELELPKMYKSYRIGKKIPVEESIRKKIERINIEDMEVYNEAVSVSSTFR